MTVVPDNNNPDISQLMQGIFKPKKFYRKTSPVYFNHINIGDPQNDKLYTKFKVWVHAPSLEFPTTGIFLGFSNGAGSAYAKVNGNDFISLIQALTQWAQDVAKIQPELDEKSKAAENQVKTWEIISQALQQQAPQQPNITKPEEDIVYEEEGA